MNIVKLLLSVLLVLGITNAPNNVAAQEASKLFAVPVATGEEKTFIQALQTATKNNDVHWISAHVFYPISVTMSGHKIKIHDTTNFEKHYNEIITYKIRNAILEQDINKLSKTPQGVMIGQGFVWVDSLILGNNPNKAPSVLIIAINN
jgi:hypothetical protein